MNIEECSLAFWILLLSVGVMGEGTPGVIYKKSIPNPGGRNNIVLILF